MMPPQSLLIGAENRSENSCMCHSGPTMYFVFYFGGLIGDAIGQCLAFLVAKIL